MRRKQFMHYDMIEYTIQGSCTLAEVRSAPARDSAAARRSRPRADRNFATFEGEGKNGRKEEESKLRKR
jgi:hypothetical protein